MTNTKDVIDELDKIAESMVGKRCLTKDTDDFPELKWHKSQKTMVVEGNDGRCLVCVTYEALDSAKSKLTKYIEQQVLIGRISELDELTELHETGAFYSLLIKDRHTTLKAQLKGKE